MTVEWFVPAGQVRPLTLALHSLIPQIRAAHGCLSCSVSTDIGERGNVRYVEEWQSEEDLRRRLECATFKALAALIDEATSPPNVEFTLSSGTRGLDFVDEVLHSKS